MWIVATDQACENWIGVFNTEEEAYEFFVDEMRRSHVLDELTDKNLLLSEYKIYVAQINDWSIIRY